MLAIAEMMNASFNDKEINDSEENSPPKIRSWEELEKCETDDYYIVVDKRYYSGCIESKHNPDEYVAYLSTHMFYGGATTKGYEKLLREKGFNIELVPYGEE